MLLPGTTAEGMASLVRLLAPGTQGKLAPRQTPRAAEEAPDHERQPARHPDKPPVMGNYATDVNSQVLMRLTTTDPAEVQGWLPGGELHTDLMALLHVYLGSRLDVRLQLCVDRSLLPDATMSTKAKVGAVQLGRTAVMRLLNAANTATHPKTITINLGRYERVQENIHAGRPMKMAIIAGKFPLIALVASITPILAGCGLTQSVTDGTVAVTKSIFYKQVKTLHLDIRAREAVNQQCRRRGTVDRDTYLPAQRPQNLRQHGLSVAVQG
jgi:hypothetical protein